MKVPSKTSIYSYVRSPSSRLAALIGGLMYVSYAAGFDAWLSPALIGVALFVGIALPSYSRLSNRIEQRANYALALVTVGRLARFSPQFLFNTAAFGVLLLGGVVDGGNLSGVGGLLGAAAITTMASQGAQYVAMFLFNRNVGDLNRNVMVALSLNIVVTALAIMGFEFVRWIFVVGGIGLGILVFGSGLLSDLRAFLFPQRGIGVFFGTFNPFHKSHVKLVRDALEKRGLSKVVIHPTIIPRAHRIWRERGEICVDRVEDGLQIYEKTAKADPYVDYFPTGHRFYAPETRRYMIELALAEAGLDDRVEVSFMPQTYARYGFHGVVREIRRAHPNTPIHGIHGSDVGGMMVRAILDECGWIYPMLFLRRDGISATAIRAGAEGMTGSSITKALRFLSQGSGEIAINGRRFRNEHGVLVPA